MTKSLILCDYYSQLEMTQLVQTTVLTRRDRIIIAEPIYIVTAHCQYIIKALRWTLHRTYDQEPNT